MSFCPATAEPVTDDVNCLASMTPTHQLRAWLNRTSMSRILAGVLVLTIAWICFQLATHRHTRILRALSVVKHFVSNASKSPVPHQLRASAPSGPQHSVNLSWKASTTPGIAYNVYRLGPSGMLKLNTAPIPQTSYVDSTVQPGETYYYVIKAASAKGIESIPSNQVRVTIPSP
jgi:hypothetical protein